MVILSGKLKSNIYEYFDDEARIGIEHIIILQSLIAGLIRMVWHKLLLANYLLKAN